MKCILRCALCRILGLRVAISRSVSGGNGKIPGLFGRADKPMVKNSSRVWRNSGQGSVESRPGSLGSRENMGESPSKGYIEISRKRWKRKPEKQPKTLSDMREDIEKLAEELHKMRSNEKSQQSERVPKKDAAEEELRLAPYVEEVAERLSFDVRTPDRRLLLKQLTGIAASRAILEMLRDRKVRINDIVIFDFAIVNDNELGLDLKQTIVVAKEAEAEVVAVAPASFTAVAVCKPMDILDVWKGELEENPAFAVVDRFQIIHIVPSSCYQYFTVHAIALKGFLVENWFPHKFLQNSLSTN